jgi:alginate O-acetyltransferase complex protein AlgI
MLFNSYSFIFVFLPVTVLGFFVVGRVASKRLSILWVAVASLIYYAWWNPPYVLLILGSILANYQIGLRLSVLNHAGRHRTGRAVLALGVAANLALLGYYKYANFFVDNLNQVVGSSLELAPVILPIGISFFTFQQVTYLVDAYRAETEEHSFLDYCLFVSFFPQLIAGPIVHHKEILPQFRKPGVLSADPYCIAMGLTAFSIGLFKKVILADTLATYATPVFTAADGGSALSFASAWIGSLAFTFQIYFDFSGYSDMAIGLALLFGIRIPLNFNSPYKAVNIIEFWRRWHMTLSRFLKDYLYIPLGGNRRGRTRRYVNVMVTMLIGGLWHGASWTFVVWGGLHGLYLVVNHGWHAVRRRFAPDTAGPTAVGTWAARALTFVAVVIGWVFFRVESFDGAVSMLSAMFGANGLTGLEEVSRRTMAFLAVGFVIVLGLPATHQLLGYSAPVAADGPQAEASRSGEQWRKWRPTLPWLVFASAIASVSIGNLIKVSEFLYYQF